MCCTEPELDEEEKNAPVKFHFKNDRDIVYAGLNVKAVLAYLSEKKKKRVVQGKVVLVSASDIKKYDDAIKWGSKIAEQPLPSEHYRKIETFIQAYNKEYKEAQKEGRTDEQETDPITSIILQVDEASNHHHQQSFLAPSIKQKQNTGRFWKMQTNANGLEIVK